jgi:16S rRNA (uracil1498-N3)-methyltransferase
VVLTPKQQHYLIRVLRLGVGDRFIVLNGQGQAWQAELIPFNSDPGSERSLEESPHAKLLEPILSHTELPISITLVMALPKGNAFDEVVRQATELGVTCIVPVLSDRTLLNPSAQKRDRWQRIAQEAAEQSERQLVPAIQAPMPFGDYLAMLPCDRSAKRYLGVTRIAAPHLLDCLLAERAKGKKKGEEQKVKDGDVGEDGDVREDSDVETERQRESGGSVVVAIGPEGGWTEAEIAAAIAIGYQPISLGSRILRAVTAPLVALSLIGAVYERGTVEQ